jgi:hypothetical protein
MAGRRRKPQPQRARRRPRSYWRREDGSRQPTRRQREPSFATGSDLREPATSEWHKGQDPTRSRRHPKSRPRLLRWHLPSAAPHRQRQRGRLRFGPAASEELSRTPPATPTRAASVWASSFRRALENYSRRKREGGGEGGNELYISGCLNLVINVKVILRCY